MYVLSAAGDATAWLDRFAFTVGAVNSAPTAMPAMSGTEVDAYLRMSRSSERYPEAKLSRAIFARRPLEVLRIVLLRGNRPVRPIEHVERLGEHVD